ncbi:hypothetical protein [Floridanema aerugineum]|uniref:Uncharacterized protein n=1 Tax=Floridaenema aerugineum BLCC-F46 TaxID=3153654 RepID=A0ABV4X2T6_9CYAN
MRSSGNLLLNEKCDRLARAVGISPCLLIKKCQSDTANSTLRDRTHFQS